MAATDRVLLVVDAANIDMTLTSFVGRPTQRDRPDFGVLARWLHDRTGPDRVPEACVFVNVATHSAGPLRGWVMWLLEQGYRVFARPKVGASDIDEDMVAHLRRRRDEGHLQEALVASNDARAFLEPLEELARDGVRVVVLGFEEFAAGLAESPLLEFVDLEDVPGLFEAHLPNRVRLDRLPEDGRWFEPVGPLGGAPGEGSSPG